jgi:hypothetical protein
MLNDESPVVCTISLETIPAGKKKCLRNHFLGEEGGILESDPETGNQYRYYARSLDINSSSLPRCAVLKEKDILRLSQMNIQFPSVEFLVISGSISSASIEKTANLFPNLIYLSITPGLELDGARNFRVFPNLKILYIETVWSSTFNEIHSISVGPLEKLVIKHCSSEFLIDGPQLTGELTKL